MTDKYEQLRQYIRDNKSNIIKEYFLYDYEILENNKIIKKEILYNYIIKDNQLNEIINLNDSGTDSYFVKIFYKNTEDYWKLNEILVKNIDGKNKHLKAEYLVMEILKELNIEFKIINTTYI